MELICGDSVKRCTGAIQAPRTGAVPDSPLHFLTGQNNEAECLVKKFHYSHKIPSVTLLVGTFHRDGGLFGDQGECIAACFFGLPASAWKERVVELTRMVRHPDTKPHLSKLVSLCCRELKKMGEDLIVSYADKEQNHYGYVYRACNWHYSGETRKAMVGIIFDGHKIHARTCVSKYGTRSPIKLKKMFPNSSIEPLYDEGKHIYWKALGRKGRKKAKRLGLKINTR